MKNINIQMVFKELPYSLLYFLIGSFSGYFTSYILFNFDKNLLETILNIWLRRILFGINFFESNNYVFWFILNNVIAMLLVVVAIILIITHIAKTPDYIITKKFRSLEKRRPKIVLSGLYMIPLGALLLNGFLLSLFIGYVWLSFGFNNFLTSLLLLLPHGIVELTALFLASSLGLTYLKILKPLILKERWEECGKIGKNLLISKTTLFIAVIIIILVVFGGFMEGTLSLIILR